MSTIYDVIIIGSGAGGGTLARHLAPSGKRILLLERGGWLPREPENWMAEEVFVKNRYVSTETWYDRHGEPFQPGVHYFVGGATKMYGAALYRLRREDFGEIRHYDGVSPAWPIPYEEMEPYYTKAEQTYHVHGARGEDPTEPPASAPYPHPAVSHEPRMQRLHDHLARAGHHPFHAPCGIVVVSCGAANSAKLLLQSANDRHPRGLANGSDQVGRHYMFHNSMAVLAISREPNPTRYQKTLGLNDFYFGMDGFEYPMGNIQMVGKSQGPMYKGEKPIEAGLVPGWALEKLAEHAVDFWLSTEDLPSPDNRVTLARDGRIQLNYRSEEHTSELQSRLHLVCRLLLEKKKKKA